MTGLIKKDLFLMKSNFKLILIIFVVFTISSINQESNNLYFMSALVSTMLFMSTFSYDEYNKWNTYATALPTGREKIVKAKYLVTLLINIVVSIITFVLSLLVGKIEGNLNVEEVSQTIFGILVATIILQSIIYPLIYKFGVEKGRIWLFVGIFGISTILGILITKVKFTLSPSIISFFNDYYLLLIPLFTLICLSISYNVSKNIYLKKEF